MRRLLVSLTIAVALALAEVLLFASPLGEDLELKTTDFWFKQRGEIIPPQDIVILAMDEHSYAELNLPTDQAWPRAIHAQMLKKLKALGVKRVVMDILFLGPSADPEADRELQEAIASVPTVLGAEDTPTEQGQGSTHYKMEKLLLPYDAFGKAAEQIALTKMPDRNGVIRNFVHPRSRMTASIPTLYEAAVGVRHTDRDLPGPRDLLRYYGPAGTITTYPYNWVMIDDARLARSAARFKDKIVFVGLDLWSALGPMQKDSFVTPFGGSQTFGVEVQATAAANLLENKWIRRLPQTAEERLLFLLAAVMIFSLTQLRPQWGALLLLGAAGVWAGAAYYSFLAGRFVPGITLFGIVLPIAFLGITLSYYLITYRAQKHVERAFSLYLPPAMARAMRSDAKVLQLGGNEVVATALFTDIAGFSSVAQMMPARETAAMLNEYFDAVTGAVFKHQGTLLKYIGDAVFVIWGAPLRISNHADLACTAGLAIVKAVKEFNSLKRFPPLDTRVGIHTGSMLVGNLGSRVRFDYTAIGDAVNLASRLEGVNKYFGTTVAISDDTRRALTAPLQSVQLGRVQVAGRSDIEAVYTLFEEPLDPGVTEQWHAALDAYWAHRWSEARHGFETMLKAEARLSKAARLYLALTTQYSAKEPEPAWSGEMVLTGK